MEEIIQSFVLQLRSFIRTNAVVMETAQLAHYLTVYAQQFDDSRQWIPEIQIKAVDCDKGNEGAIVELSIISETKKG